jgi:hypothetical protein
LSSKTKHCMSSWARALITSWCFRNIANCTKIQPLYRKYNNEPSFSDHCIFGMPTPFNYYVLTLTRHVPVTRILNRATGLRQKGVRVWVQD